MKKQQLQKLVNKYLEGNCSPDEEFLLEKYLESHNKENSEWNVKELGDKQAIEDKMYSEIMQMINNKDKSAARKVIGSQYFLRIAASIIFLLILAAGALYFNRIFNEKSSLPVWSEKSTNLGEKIVLKLSDSSEITLNADSKLRFPVRFQGSTREVYIEGEGYFKIKHDQSKPFIVHAANISTTVLGTKFNISAYPGEKEITISLVEGKVNVSNNGEEKTNKVTTLLPKQQFLYSRINNSYNVKEFDIENIIGWKDNLLKFKDEPLSKVFVRLERAYGVKFELVPKAFENYLITTNFQKGSIPAVSETIKKLTGLNYNSIKENGQVKKIIFTKKQL